MKKVIAFFKEYWVWVLMSMGFIATECYCAYTSWQSILHMPWYVTACFALGIAALYVPLSLMAIILIGMLLIINGDEID